MNMEVKYGKNKKEGARKMKFKPFSCFRRKKVA